MGEVGDCYENALVERMNGILKLEYGLDDRIPCNSPVPPFCYADSH